MPKLRAALLCLITLLFAAVPGGCWDAHEIDTLSLVSGIGVDAGQEQDAYDVTVQIRKIADREADPENPFLLLEATGTNVLEALEEIRLVNNRELYLHQNEMIIISQEQAALGIRPMLDVFLRFHETRLDVWVVISECPAKEILQVKLVQEPVTATALARMMQDQADLSPKLTVNMLNVTAALLDASTALVVPIVGIVDELGVSEISINGSAVLVSDKLTGYLDKDETLGYALGSGPVHSGLLEVTAENGKAVLYVSESSASMKTHWAGDRVQTDISVDAILSVAEITGFEGEALEDVFEKLERAAVDRIAELIYKAFEKSFSIGADIFGIGSSVNRTDPKLWDKIKPDWPDLYPETVLNISAEGILLESGKIPSALTMKGEE
jgi:spore germination protein KC